MLSVNPNGLLNGAPEFAIGSSSASHMVVLTNGNVGIGTTSPGSLLSLGTTGGINFALGTSTFGSSANGINLTNGCYAIGGNCLTASSLGAITALTGDVTASGPGSALTTLATVNSNIGTFNNVTVNGKGLVTSASNTAYLTAYDAFTHPSAGQSATTSLMILNGNATTTGLTVTGSTYLATTGGNVGIGTTAPDAPLTIKNTALNTGSINLHQNNATSGNYYNNIQFFNDTISSTNAIANFSVLAPGYPAGNLWQANDFVLLGGQGNAGTNLIFLTNTSGALKFGTGGYAAANERLRIGSNGGVSIGNSYVATDPGAGI